MQVIHKTINELLKEIAVTYPQQDAIIHTEMGVRYSFERLSAEIDRCARAFIKEGINAGDKVGLWAHNTPEWLLSFLGLTQIGAISVPIDPNATAENLHFILEQSECCGLIIPGVSGNEKFEEMALAAAIALAGWSEALIVCLGTDGTDGPTDAAPVRTRRRCAGIHGQSDESVAHASNGYRLPLALEVEQAHDQRAHAPVYRGRQPNPVQAPVEDEHKKIGDRHAKEHRPRQGHDHRRACVARAAQEGLARLIAAHHRTASGLDALGRRPAFLSLAVSQRQKAWASWRVTPTTGMRGSSPKALRQCFPKIRSSVTEFRRALASSDWGR